MAGKWRGKMAGKFSPRHAAQQEQRWISVDPQNVITL
jgi:hypothetical protein